MTTEAPSVTQLTAPDAVAATLPAAEVAQLRRNPAVKEIVPDARIQVSQVHTEAAPPPPRHAAPPSGRAPAPGPATTTVSRPIPPLRTHVIPANCPSTPVQEPEAVADIHASDGNPNAPDEANSIATGQGVIVANEGMNELAGDPDLQRADGSHVVIDAPDYTADQGNDETFEDAASIGAQGLIIYQYSKALPFSNVSPGCTFTIKGDAPDASLVDLTEIDTPDPGPVPDHRRDRQRRDHRPRGRDLRVVRQHIAADQPVRAAPGRRPTTRPSPRA